jgi:hypothetical protein
MAYRTVELTMSDETKFGSTHYLKIGSSGVFSGTFSGCSPWTDVFGCDGGNYETWPLYDKVLCGERSGRILVTGRPQSWETTFCDNRGLLEGELRVAKSESWKVVARGNGTSSKTHVEEDGKFSLLLAAGSYRVAVEKGRKHCSAPAPVKIRIAKKTRLTIHC